MGLYFGLKCRFGTSADVNGPSGPTNGALAHPGFRPGLTKRPQAAKRDLGLRDNQRFCHDFAFLHRSPHLRHGDLGGHHAGRRRGGVYVAGRPVSRRDAAHGPGDGQLPGGQRQHAARHRGGADRRAGQRRRGHAVHVLDLHQQRFLHADGDFSDGHRLGHGPGAGAEPRRPGPAGGPGPGPERGGHRQETVAGHADDRQPDRRRRQERSGLSEQLRDDLSQGRTGPRRGGRRHQLSRPARLQHEGLARSGPAGGAAPQRLRRGHRHLPAERAGGGRASRPAPRAARAAIPAHHQHQGPAHRGRGVWRHHRQGRRRRPGDNRREHRQHDRKRPGGPVHRHRPAQGRGDALPGSPRRSQFRDCRKSI